MDKNRIFMVVIIALLLVLTGLIVWFIIFGLPKLATAGGEPQVVYVTQEPDKKLTAMDITTYNLSSDISSNLAESADGKQYVIRLTMSVGVNKTADDQVDILAALAANEVIMRDFTLEILRSKTHEDLLGAEGKAALSQDILSRVQEEFDTNTVVAVYIEYITQLTK